MLKALKCFLELVTAIILEKRPDADFRTTDTITIADIEAICHATSVGEQQAEQTRI